MVYDDARRKRFARFWGKPQERSGFLLIGRGAEHRTDEHRLLATILTGALAQADDGREGLISGALSALGSELEVEGLHVFVQPDLCIAPLAPRPGSG